MPPAQSRTSDAFRYDETLHTDGSLLPGWQSLLSYIEGSSAEQLARRERDIIRQKRANGLAYHPDNNNANGGRPWTLDLIPMLFEKNNWETLTRGLQQRARIKQALYQDIYGEQQLLQSGVIPPSMLYSHHGYLRDLVSLSGTETNTSLLPMYSCDISRSPSGDWLAAQDYCQYPAGIGYALENRVVLARVLPRKFKEYRVRRIVSYFQRLQNHIHNNDTVPARCVLLSYPPTHPHYFEFAWIAKYLGYPLVEPADLTVRDSRVYLKTITGLQTVDVILRLINDAEIDPLVIGNRSSQGVPGIVEAARRGGVRILNPLGTSVLDNPALNTVLAATCEALLGEPLLLQSQTTYWLGDDDQKTHVLSNLNQLLIRNVNQASVQLDPLTMSDSERDNLLDNISLTPEAYIGQERINASVAPSLEDSGLAKTQISIRTFHVQSEGNFESMPGGLCLLTNLSDDTQEQTETVSGSKDVWILSNDPVPAGSLSSSRFDASQYDAHNDSLPSRVAEAVFWMGRNSERVESTLRLLRNILQLLIDTDRSLEENLASPVMESLLKSVTAATSTLPGFIGKGAQKRLRQPDPELISLLQDTARVGSLPNSLQQLQLSASSISDRLSTDQLQVFRRLSDIQSTLTTLKLPIDFCSDEGALNQTVELLDELLLVVSANTGLQHENVTHSDDWLFTMLGKRVERAYQIAITVDTAISVDQENQRVLESLLFLFDSVMTYRSRYRIGLNNRLVLQLLLLDEINPRSLAYQFRRIQELINDLPGRRDANNTDRISRLVVSGLSRVRLAEPELLLDEQSDARQDLSMFLHMLQQIPNDMSDAVTSQYFTHSEKRHDLGRFKIAHTDALKAVDDASPRPQT